MAAVLFSSCFLALGYLNASQSAGKIFGYLVSVTTVFGVLNWTNILLAYFGMLRAMRAQRVPRSELPYKGFAQPYASMFALSFTILIVIFNGLSLTTSSLQAKSNRPQDSNLSWANSSWIDS